MAEPRCISGAYRAQLGESPLWDEQQRCLYFVDIIAPCIDRIRLNNALADAGEAPKRWRLPNWVGCIALRKQGGLLAALACSEDHSGGALFAVELPEDGEDAVCTRLLNLPLEPHSCPNDGKSDAQGRLWVGAKTLQAHPAYGPDASGMPVPDPASAPPSGRLFRADDAASAVRVVSEVGAVSVSNGIGFSPDGSTMYYVDSPARCVFAFDCKQADGTLSTRRVLADTTAFAPGAVPDGLAVDAEGGVWVALWDGGAVVRIDAEGKLQRRVVMPVSRPTCVAFGADNALFVTSCSYDVGDAAPLQEPLAGAVFVVDAGVAGARVPCCNL